MSDIRKRALELYKAPFSLDHGYVWDANGKMFADSVNGARVDPIVVAQVRGWGHIQKLDDPENLQDKVGELIVEALNEKWSGELTQANKRIEGLSNIIDAVQQHIVETDRGLLLADDAVKALARYSVLVKEIKDNE